MAEENATPDELVAKIAARQHGVVSIGQLHTVRLSADAVLGRLRAGRLHRIHRGVYAVGHPGLSRHGRWLAAVLACEAVTTAAGHRAVPPDQWNVLADHRGVAPGPPSKGQKGRRTAVLSHRSAAALWGLLPPGDGAIEVTVSGDGGRMRRNGIHLHRSRTLTPEMVRRHKGIPVTTPVRTISDLRRAVSAKDPQGAVSPRELRRAIRQAEVLGLSIGSDAVGDQTRSELEYLFLRLCRRHRLPPPEVNVRIGSFIVDFLWSDRMLIVETDGYRYHRGRSVFEDDRDRDLKLRALGYEVIRLSHRQVVDEPQPVVAALKELLVGPGLVMHE